MVAVAAEAVSRLLFFGLADDPDLLARLFVLYFEKGSAADPSAERREIEGGGGEEEAEEFDDGDVDAKEVGSSVRLSQVGWGGRGRGVDVDGVSRDVGDPEDGGDGGGGCDSVFDEPVEDTVNIL